MNLSTIIEKKKDEFAFFLDGMGFSNEDIEVILPQAEKAIRESVEEALRKVIVFRKAGTTAYMVGYEDALKDLYARVKEFMK